MVHNLKLTDMNLEALIEKFFKGELTMEKKFEPTPEMKAMLEKLKAKVEAHETRELSADELDSIAGGQGIFVRDGSTDYLAKDPIACEYFKGGWKDKKDAVLRRLGVQ